MPLPFEQQPRESAKAFAAFTMYLSLGPQRSLAAVGQKLGKSKALLERWSGRWQWGARVASYGAHVAEVERAKIEEQAAARAVDWCKMGDTVRRLAWVKGDELIKMADEFLDRWRKSTRVPGLESVVSSLALAVKLKQFAAGLPSEIREVNTTVSGKVGVEWEVALKRVYGQAKAALPVVEVEAVAEPAALPPAEVTK